MSEGNLFDPRTVQAGQKWTFKGTDDTYTVTSVCREVRRANVKDSMGHDAGYVILRRDYTLCPDEWEYCG